MNYTLISAAINGFLVVLLGAFGAHGLEDMISVERLNTWNTGVQYHMFHTTVLFGTGILFNFCPEKALLKRSATLFLTGIVIFSGSLYLLAVSGVSKLGMITPIGGVAFLGGWACLFVALKKGARHD